MKKIFLILFIFCFNSNVAFAKNPNSFIEEIAKSNNKEIDKEDGNSKYYLLYKGILTCEPYENIKNKNYKTEICTNNSEFFTLRITNLKTSEIQEYGWTKLDLMIFMQQNHFIPLP